MRWILGAALLVALIAAPARGTSPLVAELLSFFNRYHENPARLDAIRAELEEAVKTDPDVPNLLALAQVCFIWGDIRATSEEQKLQAYDRGRQAAERAVELEPKNVWAHLWFGINTGRWGQTKGVVRSLFLLPTVKREIDTILELDPKLPPAYAFAGNVYYEVPGLLGGGLDTAERMFRKGLELNPRFTSMRVGLARVLIKQGRVAEAQQELQRVLDERNPENLADWTMKDSKRARALLDSLNKPS
ncbi:MAG TPA: tetratricopeptide repeat protein [Candidatus Methylomirabilis sp.]|nr:tetratricopeptide repeat protein [Candidatus Methylomirabilis sp.]